MEGRPPSIFAIDVPLPGSVLQNVPLPPHPPQGRPPLLPNPQAQIPQPAPPLLPVEDEPPKPPALPKPSQKGIEQAKKMLRAFSIQRKQTAPAATKTPAAGPSKGAVGTGEPGKEKNKFEKLRKLPSTHPLFKPLEPDILRQSKEHLRKMEIAELGIPLSLIQPGDQAMPNKAWPSKAMPPTYLLSPEQVDELIMKAREAKAQGKKFKFNFREYFPSYDNPFQQGRIKLLEKEEKVIRKITDAEEVKTKHTDKKTSKKRSSRSVNDRSKDKSGRHTDAERKREAEEKDKEVNLNDYVVCDSWSLDTEDKTDDGTPKSEAKSMKSLDEPTPKADLKANKFIEVKDNDVALPVDIPKPKDISTERTETGIQRIENVDPKQVILDTMTKLAKKKLRPVVDEFIYDLDDDSSDNSQEAPKSMKEQIKTLKTTINSEKSKEPDIEITSFRAIDDIPMPAKNKSKSPHTSVDSKDKHEGKEKSSSRSQSTSSRRNESSYDTPEYLKDSKYLSDYQASEDRDTPVIEIEKAESKPIEKQTNSDYDSNVYDKYVGSDERKNDATPESLGPPKISKEMEECLDTWNFVLKICQPLLFRHDRNKCYRETKTQPPVWYTENPRLCSCVKDRGVVYEELEITKMDLVDKVYGCDQILDDNPQTQRDWYPREDNCIVEVATLPPQTIAPQKPTTEPRALTPVPPPNKDLETINSPPIFSDDQRNSLDREYEKFMEAVWSDKAKSPVTKKEDRAAKERAKKAEKAPEEKEKRIKVRTAVNKEKKESVKTKVTDKVKEVTSELGTSMDESVLSVDDDYVRKDKKKKDKEPKKIVKASSEYWSEDSVADTSEDKKHDKETKRKPVKKEKKKHRSSSSGTDSSDEESSSQEEMKPKDSKDKKKKSKASKEKDSRKRRISQKRRLEKLKQKRLKKIKKLKEKVQRSLEEDEDVGEIIKKEKLKKKDEVKSKDKKKTKTKKKKEESKKKKVSSSSSSTSTSTSSSSSSDSEEERERRKKKKRKQKEATAKAEKEKKKVKSKKKRKASESYSEDEEQFDMNILNNIKMEQVSDDEVSKLQIDDDFSPRRPSTKNKEIVSVSELHSDFVGRTIKEERVDMEDQKKTEIEAEEVNITRVDELKKIEVNSPNVVSERVSPKITEIIIAQDSPLADAAELKSSSIFSIGNEAPEDSIASPALQESIQKIDTTSVLESQNSELADVSLPNKNDAAKPASPKIIHQAKDNVDVSQKEAEKPIAVVPIQVVPEENYDYQHDPKDFAYENYDEYMSGEQTMEFSGQNPIPPSEHYYASECEARPIETVISTTGTRGEIKCDWRPTKDTVRPPTMKSSRWGMQNKPSGANIVLTSTADDDLYPIQNVLETKQYRIETISNVRGSMNEEADYDGAYADMYGESDRLQYGDCFDTRAAQKVLATPARLSLDDRIGLVLKQSVLGQVAKEASPPQQHNETGILINRLSPSGIESTRRVKRVDKRVSFADGFNPGQDSDSEQPVTKKKRTRRRYGCAWPCPATHPDHVPLWDALPPPPPPPGSPPPPAAPPPPPPHVLRAGKRRHRSSLRSELPQLLLPEDEPVAKITRLPKGLGHPSA